MTIIPQSQRPVSDSSESKILQNLTLVIFQNVKLFFHFHPRKEYSSDLNPLNEVLTVEPGVYWIR